MARTNTNTGGGGGGVTSVNSLVGAVTLTAGTNVTLNTVGNNITINSSGGGVSLGGSQTGFASGMIQYISSDVTPVQWGDGDFIRDSLTHDTFIGKTISGQDYIMTVGDPMVGFDVSALMFNDNAGSGNAVVAVLDAVNLGGNAGDGAGIFNATDTTGNIAAQMFMIPNSLFVSTSDQSTGEESKFSAFLGGGGINMSYTDGVSPAAYFFVITDAPAWGQAGNDFRLPLNSPADGDVLTAPAGGGYGQTRWAPAGGSATLTIGDPVVGATPPAVLYVDGSNTLQAAGNVNGFINGNLTHVPYYDNAGSGLLTDDSEFTRDNTTHATLISSDGLIQTDYNIGLQFGGSIGNQMLLEYFDTVNGDGTKMIFEDDTWSASVQTAGGSDKFASIGMSFMPSPSLNIQMVDQVSTLGENIIFNPGFTTMQAFDITNGRTAITEHNANSAAGFVKSTYTDTVSNSGGEIQVQNLFGASLQYSYNLSGALDNKLTVSPTRLVYTSDYVVAGSVYLSLNASTELYEIGDLTGSGNNTKISLGDSTGNEFIVASANNLIQLNSDRVHLNGGQRVSYFYAGADANQVLQTNMYSVGMDPATGGVLATLPASPFSGDIHIIGDALGNAAPVTNAISVSGNGHNIRGASNDSITTPFQFRTYEYDGTNGIWQIISIS